MPLFAKNHFQSSVFISPIKRKRDLRFAKTGLPGLGTKEQVI
ncbi:hypothetical protein D1AOALGA4SA_5758 [Olavius algarvensis Delta 1 endosymbiont]|nr:hypothetical protein D1AOALGA4SA_5758 [Olavius algarvensis Delta 1 endosymbiont]